MATKRKDPDGTERVVMVWPKDLKDKVRDRAGHRGITEFVTKAVETYLGEVPKPDSENKRVFVPDSAVASTLSEPQETPIHKPNKAAAAPESAPEPEDPGAQDLPHDTSGRDDLFARLMAKTGGGVDFDAMKAQLKPASEIPKPQKDSCPRCGEELVDGECWTCD